MADNVKSETSTLLPRLASFLMRERKLARRYVLTTVTHGDAVEEWNLEESSLADDGYIDGVAGEILLCAVSYATNAEARIDFVLRAFGTAQESRGTMRFRAKHMPEEAQFSPETPEGKLLAYALKTMERQSEIIRALPETTVKVYDRLLAAAASENERLVRTNGNQAVEIRLLYDALREGVGVDEERAAEAKESEEKAALGSELREIGTAIVARLVRAPADAAADAAANGAAGKEASS